MMICCSVVISYVLDFRSRIVFGRKLPSYVDDSVYIVAGYSVYMLSACGSSYGYVVRSVIYKFVI